MVLSVKAKIVQLGEQHRELLVDGADAVGVEIGESLPPRWFGRNVANT